MPAIDHFPEDPVKVDELIQPELHDRQRYIGRAWRYYTGDHKKPLKVREGEPDDNVILNLCKRLVNESVAMLVGRGVRFEIVEGAQTPAEDALAEFWRKNRKQLFLSELAVTGAVTGQPVVQFVPPAGDRDWWRLVSIQPQLLSLMWSPTDRANIIAYVFRWEVNGVEYRQDVIAPGQLGNGGWLIRGWRRQSLGRWELQSEELWPYSWAPVLTWQNFPNPGKVYGLSDLESAELNDAVNMVASNVNRILRFHAHPRTIGLGVMPSDVQTTAISDFWAIPAKDAKVFNLEMQSDLQSSMRFLDFLRGAFFSEGAGVDVTIFRDKIGQITNFGLRVLFQDALDRLALKQETYGEALTEINRRALAVAGFGSDVRVKIHWPDPLPKDNEALAKLVNMEIAAGLVSKETAATELGHDWTTEQERIQGEAQSEENLGTLLVRAFHGGKVA